MTYAEKLRDPRWQKRRLKVMEYAHWRCQICGAKDRTLHCHHSYYTRGKQPWQYPDGSIICICEVCHEKIHPEKAIPAAPPTPLPVEVQREPEPDYGPKPTESEAKSRFARLRAMLETIPGNIGVNS